MKGNNFGWPEAIEGEIALASTVGPIRIEPGQPAPLGCEVTVALDYRYPGDGGGARDGGHHANDLV
jgi:hypothetical protein